LSPRRRMRSGRGNILRIKVAKASHPSRGFHALFKGYETAIRAAADCSTAVNRAPRIVLGLGACSNADDTDANSQHQQQEPHNRLLRGHIAIIDHPRPGLEYKHTVALLDHQPRSGGPGGILQGARPKHEGHFDNCLFCFCDELTDCFEPMPGMRCLRLQFQRQKSALRRLA